MKRILVLGSTGSIGSDTLEVIAEHRDLYKVDALVAGNNRNKLISQAIAFKPKKVVIFNETNLSEIKDALSHYGIKVYAGRDAIIDICREPFDFVMSSITGFAGLEPNINVIKHSNVVAIANKESLICAGDLLLASAKNNNCKIIPVDSEHMAIFQILEDHNYDEIDKITLTASGGPFRTWTTKDMKRVTKQMALKHPNWSMGAKITIDCATLINKGLEVIEAYRLFGIDPNNIEVIVHPESIIHGLISYKDGSVLAQLSSPNMRTPISYALSYPYRTEITHKKLDLTELGSLNFEKPDYDRFPLLRLSRQCIFLGNYALIALNTSNEFAVGAFLNNLIKFSDIASIVIKVVEQAKPMHLDSFEEIFEYNRYISELSEKSVMKYYL
jgi:1-deoxy-D-xylulose-5-phosphate reductoisomerase